MFYLIIYLIILKIIMADSQEGAITCKVVLIGESGVGKTSIISRYINNTFKSQLMSTPGANFVTKNVIMEDDNQSIKFEIWDTAGQERYRALAKVFYKNAAVCVLVYDITRKTSFNELKNYWYKEIKENAQSNVSKKKI
jgi:small GTP-binding protein